MRMLTPLRVKNYLRLNINLFSVYVKPNITLLAGSMATCSKSEKYRIIKTSKQLFKDWIQIPRRTPNKIIEVIISF